MYMYVAKNDCIGRASRVSPTTPTLVGPKILSFMVKALYFQSSGRTNNCQIEVIYKWSDQSSTPSTIPGRVTYFDWLKGVKRGMHYSDFVFPCTLN